MVEEAAQRPSFDVQRSRRNGRREAHVSIGVQEPPLRHAGAGLLRVDRREDANGVALAHVYFEDEPTRRGLVNRLSGPDAKAVAQTIARALTAAARPI